MSAAATFSGCRAVYLGKREEKDLVYMGKVGTRWSWTVSSKIRKQLETVVSPNQKAQGHIGGADIFRRR